MKEKRTVLSRLLAGLLALLLLLPCVPLALVASAEGSVTPAAPSELQSENVSKYLHKSIQVTDAATNFPNAYVPQTLLGIPVNLHFYYDSAKKYPANSEGVAGSVVILYVMNTRVPRIGTDSDAAIVERLIGRGYYVIVMDYLDNENTVSPYLEWSVQNIRTQIIDGTIETPDRAVDGLSTNSHIVSNYVLPAGYDIAYEVPYFAYDLHGAAGTLERIVEIWNNDFKSVKRASLVKWVNADGTPKLDKTDAITVKSVNDTREIDYATWFTDLEMTKSISQAELEKLTAEEQKKYPFTYVGNTKATTVYDCVKPDGSFIDLNLYMDLIYPTGTDIASVPVMVALSSGYTRSGATTTADRPQLQGFLFRGYAGVVSAYGLVPMARADHYGYFCGDSQMNSVSGDNYTYSLAVYNGVKSDTAMLRTLRKAAADGIEIDGVVQKFPFLSDKIGVFGNSKAGVASRLGTTSPETLEELRHLEGHVGETRYDHIADKTYGNLGYKDPYLNDGVVDAAGNKLVRDPVAQPYTEFSSRANLTYAECGGAQATVEEGQSPVFCTGTQMGGDCSYWVFYRGLMNQCRNANVPFYGLISPKCGHTFGTGPDKFYGIDTYAAFHRYTNYWFMDAAPTCEIIDVDNPGFIGTDAEGFNGTNESLTIDRVYEIGAGASIKFQFIGPIDGSEIGKISVTDALTGEPLVGCWNSYFGDQQWEFVPYNIKEGTYYTVTVPTTIRAKNGKCLAEEKSLTFRTVSGVTETTGTVGGSETVTDKNNAYFVFEAEDYSEMHSVLLRFSVKNEATNRIVITAVTDYNEDDPSLSALGEELGEIAVYGAGAYTFDVTKYVKGKSGRIVFRASAKYAGGRTTLTDADFENSTVGAQHLMSSVGQIIAANPSRTVISDDTVGGRSSKTMRLDYILPRASYVNLAGDLEGNSVFNHSDTIFFHKGISETKRLTEEDLGRTIRFTFSLYDTTSRQIHIGAQGVESGRVVDFRAIDKTIRTEPGVWKTYSIEFTYEELISVTTLNRVVFFLSIENKTQVLATDKLAIAPSGRANASAATNARFPTKNGYNTDDFTYIDYLGKEPSKETGIEMNTEKYFPLYFDDFLVEEVYTEVELFGEAALVARPEESSTLPVDTAVTVGGETPDGTLSVGGGSYGTDKESKKVYVRFDLSAYTGGVASIAFRATGADTAFSVYGLKTAAAWSKDTITAENAPANDPSSSGLLLSAVYGGAPLASYTVAEDNTLFRLDITDYAKEMKAQGADALTLIFISDTESSETPTTYTFSDKSKPSMGIKGSGEIHAEAAGVFESVVDPSDAGNHVLRLYPASSYMKASNAGFQMSLGGALGTWTEADLGTSYLVTFRIRASKEGSVTLGMRKRYYCYWEVDENGNKIDGKCDPGNWEKANHPDCPTEVVTIEKAGEWQTVTYRFTLANANMLPTKFRPTNNSYYAVNQLAISTYDGMGVGSYDGDADALYVDIDDLSVTKISGETTIEIIDCPSDTIKASYDFTGTNKPSAMLRNNGIKDVGNEAAQYNGYEIADDGSGSNSVLYIYPNQLYNSINNDRVSLQLELKNALGGEWLDTDYKNNDDKYKNSPEVGKTYRVTFFVKASKAGTFTLGMQKEQWTSSGNSDGTHVDSANWAWSQYSGTPIQTVSVTTDWTKVVYEFTVTEDMLPKLRGTNYYGVTKLSLQSLVSGFGASGDGYNAEDPDKSIWLAIDNMTVYEVNKTETPYQKAISVSGWNDLGNYTMYGWTSEFLKIVNGGITIRPNQMANASANANTNIQLINSLSDILKAENVGRTYHISFRARADMLGFLDYGFTTPVSAKSKDGTLDYRTNFYEGKTGVAEITEVDTWQRFGFDFTVDEGMLSENLSVDSAVFGLAFKFYNGYRDPNGKRYKDTTIDLADFSIVEVGTLKDTSTLPTAESVTLTGDGAEEGLLLKKGGALPLLGVKKSYLTFTTNVVSTLYAATLHLTITEANGETVTLSLLGEDTPIATFTASVGALSIDITEIVRQHPNESITLVLSSDTLDGNVVIDAGTSAPTLTVESEKKEVFDQSSFKVKGNITLASDFLYHVYVPAIAALTSLTLDDEALDLATLPTKLIDGTLYYVVTKPIAPKDGTKAFTLKATVLADGETKTATYNLSIPTYAAKIVDNATYNDTTKTLMRDILSYISAAMTYFDTSTDEAQNTITEIVKEGYNSDLTAADVGLNKTGTATDSGKALSDICLNLDATPSFVFYLKEGKESLADTFKFTSASGAPLTVTVKKETSGQKRTYLEVTTYAYAMGDTLTFTYTDEAGAQTGTYHLAAYYQGGTSDANLSPLLLRLAKYAKSASAYRDSVLNPEGN